MYSGFGSLCEKDYVTVEKKSGIDKEVFSVEKIPKMIKNLKKEMRKYARDMEFEKAADTRDKIKELEELELSLR